MHTYSKEKDGTYAVGLWLTTAMEYRFMPLFYVADHANAIAAACTLNGAEPTEFSILKEPPAKSRPTVPWWAAVLIGMLISLVFRLH